MNTKTVFTPSRHEFSQENDFVVNLLYSNIVVFDSLKRFFHLIQLVVVGGKKSLGFCPGVLMNIFHDRPRNRNPIVGTCTSAQFIKKHKTPFRDIIDDIGCFVHFHHKRGFAQRYIVRCADAGKDLIHQSYLCGFCRDKTPYLRHNSDQRRLAQ
ncbi:hypothetical protein SDC9_122781 [bioreactor metagenome]|uniref:Uncharacterized protein n=1 Tax=bioreactor metagenome TaxID=1076179 RepID=A0A645CFR2_9ZZZZ